MTTDKPDLGKGIVSSALPEGAMLAGCFEGEPVLLVRQGGHVCALSGKCTHLDAPLDEGLIVGNEIICPWHHARFRIDSGEAVAAPAFDPLKRFAIEERAGRLMVVGKEQAKDYSRATATVPQRIVIIGGGAAGHACAEMLARHGHGGWVTMISDDNDPPYDRTFCSKQYLIGMVERDDCFLADASLYAGEGPVLHLRQRVVSIDSDGRRISLDDGREVAFDTLVLATGAEPGRLERPGFDRPDVHVLRTLSDADAIIAAASPGKSAVVIGASFIGLEVAASLTQRDLSVDVIASDAIPLANILGPEVGRMIGLVHEEKGVRFHLEHEARSYDGRQVTLEDGSTIAADFVVLGLGVSPRIELARAAGLDCASEQEGGGVIVDETLETSVSGIFAIGDIARYPEARLGKDIRVEHWVHAERQGQHVARVLMGHRQAFTETPFFWSAHFDTGLRYLGNARPEDLRVSGSITGRNFSIDYREGERIAAVATCNRDTKALEVDATWNRAIDRSE
jgi:NADPH-dependent 2,4-dienoyl-CoA reductase/sulfur reductase-like enzyme/nitrite reductase/ring-hydroxylating ferredoxin subunit